MLTPPWGLPLKRVELKEGNRVTYVFDASELKPGSEIECTEFVRCAGWRYDGRRSSPGNWGSPHLIIDLDTTQVAAKITYPEPIDDRTSAAHAEFP